jgi:hypothetical protein
MLSEAVQYAGHAIEHSTGQRARPLSHSRPPRSHTTSF